MWLRLLRIVSFLGLTAAYLGALLLCWSVPRLIFSDSPTDNFWGMGDVNLREVMLLSGPTCVVGLTCWAIAWWLLRRDTPDESGAPVPEAYLAFFTILGLVFTALITWRELMLFGSFVNVPHERYKTTIAGLIGGVFAIVVSLYVLIYHASLWRRYRRYFKKSG